MKYCTKCGKPLQDGEVCSCQTQNTTEQTAQAAQEQAAQAQQAAQGTTGAGPEAGPAPDGFQGDDVVDGDYKEV